MSEESCPLMYAVRKHIATELGNSPLAFESLNCSAPATWKCWSGSARR